MLEQSNPKCLIAILELKHRLRAPRRERWTVTCSHAADARSSLRYFHCLHMQHPPRSLWALGPLSHRVTVTWRNRQSRVSTVCCRVCMGFLWVLPSPHNVRPTYDGVSFTFVNVCVDFCIKADSTKNASERSDLTVCMLVVSAP